jgi:uncharacterized membrane protein YhaH (DUF805 family)
MVESLVHLWPTGALSAAVTCVTESDGQQACNTAGLFAGLGVILFIYLAFAVIGIIAAVKVITKAGYSGWWILITFVPLVGAIFVLVFAFSKWPITSEVEMLRARFASAGGYGQPGRYGPGPAFPSPIPNPNPNFRPPGGPSIPSMPPESTASPTESTESDLQQTPIPSFGDFLQGGMPTVAASPTGPPTTPPPSTDLPPAGWFPAPGGPPGQQRYWDGSKWTDHFS